MSSPERGPEGTLEVRRLGLVPYEEAHRLQLELVGERAEDRVSDVLVLTEHHEVVTVGRKSDAAERAELARLDVPVVEVERGGEATWHGPDQVVAYPIFKLTERRRDLHRFLRDLEEVVIRVLGELEVEGTRRDGLTGVWIGSQKVCSVGVAVRRWVTYHGLALNVGNDLARQQSFRPCGLEPGVMTRLVDHTELPPAKLLIEVLLVKHFCEVFDLELPPPPPLASPDPASLPIFPG